MTTNVLTYNHSSDDKSIVTQSHLFYFWLFILILILLLLPYPFVFGINSEGCNHFVCDVKGNYLAALASFLPVICALGLLFSILGIIRVLQQITPTTLKLSQLWRLQIDSKPLTKLNKLFKLTYTLSIVLCMSLLMLDIVVIRYSGIFGSTVGNVGLGTVYVAPALLGELNIYILPVPLFALWSVYFIKRLSILVTQ